MCSTKYRGVIFDKEVDKILEHTYLEIEKWHEGKFLEIKIEKYHVHLIIQFLPMYSAKKVIQFVKTITAREIFIQKPEVKKELWKGNSVRMGFK